MFNVVSVWLIFEIGHQLVEFLVAQNALLDFLDDNFCVDGGEFIERPRALHVPNPLCDRIGFTLLFEDHSK